MSVWTGANTSPNRRVFTRFWFLKRRASRRFSCHFFDRRDERRLGAVVSAVFRMLLLALWFTARHVGGSFHNVRPEQTWYETGSHQLTLCQVASVWSTELAAAKSPQVASVLLDLSVEKAVVEGAPQTPAVRARAVSPCSLPGKCVPPDVRRRAGRAFPCADHCLEPSGCEFPYECSGTLQATVPASA